MISQASPDSSTVVYIADQDTDNVFELYSVALADGEVTKLSDALVEGGDLVHFEISPDSSTVVYVADQDTDSVYELYSVPIHGGIPTRIHAPLHLFGTEGVQDLRISPDGSMVFFTADFDPSAETYALYRVPITGGVTSQVAGPLSVGREFDDFMISPDGSVVVYLADEDIENYPELYRVSIGEGVSTKISGVFAPIGSGVENFQISPDGSTVVYRKDAFFTTALYSVPITGGIPAMLNDSLSSGSSPFPTSDVSSFSISADSSTVVYRADEDTDEISEIYAVPIDGGPPSKLNGSLVAGGAVHSYLISEDSSTVVYRADQDTDGVFELYSVPTMGGAVTNLNGSLVAGGDVSTFQISKDSSTVIYNADEDDNSVQELYQVDIDGGPATKVNAPLVAGGDVAPFLFNPLLPFYITADNSTVVYLADQDTDGVPELYATWIREEESGVIMGAWLAANWREIHFTEEELANPWLEAGLWGWEADPDGDGLANLMEYALDGDPHVGSLQFADGSYMGAELNIEGGLAVVRFPERTDAGMRGLEYELEYSTDMENWNPIPSSAPILESSTTYNPTIPGFQQSVRHWNIAHDRIFIRLRASFETLILR